VSSVYKVTIVRAQLISKRIRFNSQNVIRPF
jgi:hypothetical protein